MNLNGSAGLPNFRYKLYSDLGLAEMLSRLRLDCSVRKNRARQVSIELRFPGHTGGAAISYISSGCLGQSSIGYRLYFATHAIKE